MDAAATPNKLILTPPNQKRTTLRMKYVLLTPISMITPNKSKLSQPQPPQRPPSPLLGRGHRVKKPNARLYAALHDNKNCSADDSGSDFENMPKTPRPPAKKSRRTKSVEDADHEPVRIWCHQCHQDRSTEMTHRCSPCGKSYCAGCLSRR